MNRAWRAMKSVLRSNSADSEAFSTAERSSAAAEQRPEMATKRAAWLRADRAPRRAAALGIVSKCATALRIRRGGRRPSGNTRMTLARQARTERRRPPKSAHRPAWPPEGRRSTALHARTRTVPCREDRWPAGRAARLERRGELPRRCARGRCCIAARLLPCAHVAPHHLLRASSPRRECAGRSGIGRAILEDAGGRIGRPGPASPWSQRCPDDRLGQFSAWPWPRPRLGPLARRG